MWKKFRHKTTVYEHPRIMIFVSRAGDLRITRNGERVIITGAATNPVS